LNLRAFQTTLVKRCLDRVFELLDGDCDESVSLREVQAAFLMFAAGSKSDKLAVAFQLFDADSGVPGS
jgi:Ca2+-binding EF-hand superfamily protein